MAKPVPSKALLFIPDISGFTAFVHNTEIKHSQHIISELLELLIDSNEIGLELVEIEGDALFYFRQGALPGYSDLMAQVKKMFIKFHHHLKLYEKRRICQCGACTTAQNELKLKFVLHYGDIDFINVKGRIKPLGSSVIAVHRLLKNSIPINEYTLISQDLVEALPSDAPAKIGIPGVETFSEIGAINYQYLALDEWSKEVPQVPDLVIDEHKKLKPVERTIDIDKSILDVYEVLTNLNHRIGWNPDLDSLDYDEKELNQEGTEHTCVIDGKNIHFISRRDQTTNKDWIYIEQTEDVPFINKVSNYFVLSKKGTGTRINASVYIEPKNFLSYLFIPFIKRKLTKSLKEVLANIKQYAEGNSLAQ